MFNQTFLADMAWKWTSCHGTGKTAEWKQPISFDEFILPEFPTEALPEPIRDYVIALA